MISYEQFSKIQTLSKKISSSLARKFFNESNEFLSIFETNILGDLLQMDDNKLIELSSSPNIPDAYLEIFNSRKNEINNIVHENMDNKDDYTSLFDKTIDEVKSDNIKDCKKILNRAIFFNPYLMHYLEDSNIPFDVKIKTIRTMDTILTQSDFEKEQEKEQKYEQEYEQEEEDLNLFN